MNKKGFTLIELLAVIVVLAILLALTVMAVTNYLENSRQNTMKITATNVVDSVKRKQVFGTTKKVLYNVLEEDKDVLEKPLVDSPWGNKYKEVKVSIKDKVYYICIVDTNGKGILATEDQLINDNVDTYDVDSCDGLVVEKENLDKSGANAPALLTNMIPVYYDQTCNNNAGCWEKADATNAEYNWYNYDEKMWANAVTVDSTNRDTYKSARKGTEIPMDEINAMWVWIPRYTYTYFNDGTNTPKEIQISFEKGTASSGTITCTDNVSKSGTTSQTCTDKNTTTLVAGTSTYTHPAFDFGGTPLTGFWMGKFENSATSIPTSASTAEHTLIIKPNQTSLRYKAISYQFKDARQMEKANNIYGFEQSTSTTFNLKGELTGDTNNIDTHMLKNIEWGAVVYLSHSKYGKNSEIAINSYSDYMTGCGPQSSTTTDAGTTCNAYNTDLGQTSSTTGNVYGVYDMSGGAYDRVMGNMVNSSGNFYPASAEQWSSTTKPLAKYYDSYTYYDLGGYAIYTRGRLGDATVEMAPTGTSDNWYFDSATFVGSSSSWFFRGGGQGDGVSAGAFHFDRNYGTGNRDYGYHSALVVLD